MRSSRVGARITEVGRRSTLLIPVLRAVFPAPPWFTEHIITGPSSG